MQSNDHHSHGAAGDMLATAESPMGDLTAELKALVDQLESGVGSRQRPSWDAADELRRLRQRAQRLFNDFD